MTHNAALFIDGFVILAYFVVIVGIGLYAGRRNDTLQEFALGGHKIPWWAVLASIIAAETSAATFLGTPAEGYKTLGFAYAQLAIGTILARIIIAYLFIAPYFQFKVQSIYEYLTVRFGPRTKNMASGIFLLGRVLGIGVRLYLGGVILVVIWRYLFPGTEITIWTYFWGIVFVTAVTAAYTAVGGIKAVVWTDLIQACLMCGAVIFAIFTILNHIPGGLGKVHEMLDGHQVAMFQTGWEATKPFGDALRQMLENPYTILAAILGSTFLTMATHGTDQDMVQRMLTAENIKKSRFSLIVSGFADIPIVLAFLAVGILLWVYYQISPDPSLPAAHNEIFAHYIVHEMPAGIRGDHALEVERVDIPRRTLKDFVVQRLGAAHIAGLMKTDGFLKERQSRAVYHVAASRAARTTASRCWSRALSCACASGVNAVLLRASSMTRMALKSHPFSARISASPW